MGVSRSASRWIVLSCGARLDESASKPGGVGQRLARSLAEARTLVPSERIIVVAFESESPWWAACVVDLPEENVVEEPIDRGSGIGVLIAALRILRRDPNAEIIVASVDAHSGAIASAATTNVRLFHDDRLLIGLCPSGRLAVCRASLRAFLRLFREAQPEVFGLLCEHELDQRALDELYPFLPALDFERDVLGAVPNRADRSSAPAFAHA